jgi:type I restriction enzyme M protein
MGGRCAVVVPDGMLVNSSSCHNDTRKYLLDHFELKRVIKMKGQFFMNTGIQPSILFFEKTGKPTEVVEFWEVVKGDKGEITETMVVAVPCATIKEDMS